MTNFVKKPIKYALAVVFMAIVLPIVARAQTAEPDTTVVPAVFNIYDRIKKADNGSEIVFEQDSRVSGLLKQHFDKGGSGRYTKGWRIRIFRDNTHDGRSRSESIMYSFKQNYPGIPTYMTYKAPYWYVAVGDFRTRDEAEKMKKDMRNSYSSASLIEELINFPPL